jgi:hypothetical protein
MICIRRAFPLILCGLLLAHLALCGVAMAQDPNVESQKIEEISLSLTPAIEPRPALKFSLWPSARDLQPGNAAPFYYRAMLLHRSNAQTLRESFPPEMTAKWLDVPLADLPAEEIRRYLDAHQNVLRELNVAVLRETCDWDLRVQDLRGTQVISMLLHDFQEMRDLSRLLAYKARWEVQQGKFEEAIATMRMGYRMAHDAARPPLLINALIGIAIAAQTNVAALDLIDAPQSPNLYWALKQLPHPLVDIRPAMEFEMRMPYQIFPFLSDAETAERSPEEWRKLLEQAALQLREVGVEVNPLRGVDETNGGLQHLQTQFLATTLMMRAYPDAKKELITGGMPPDRVEQMPVAQVVAIQAARAYRYTYEEVFKWSLVPFPEGYPRARASLDRLREEGYMGQPFSNKEVLPIASLLLPAIDSVMIASARAERRQAALETIEAVRMHAAANRGELPSTLENLIVPAAKNPFTGQNFDYHVADQQAVLEERSVGVEPVRAGDRKYLLKMLQAN